MAGLLRIEMTLSAKKRIKAQTDEVQLEIHRQLAEMAQLHADAVIRRSVMIKGTGYTVVCMAVPEDRKLWVLDLILV